MSSLEAASMDALKRVMFPSDTTVSLSPAERRTLAVWAYKTALVLECVLPSGLDIPKIPKSMYEDFYADRKPPIVGVCIWTAAYNRAQWSGRAQRHPLVLDWHNPKTHAAVKTSHYSLTTFTAFSAVFQVLCHVGGHWRPLRNQPGADAFFLLPLWPLDNVGQSLWPAGGVALNNQQVEQLSVRQDFR